ncbi:MAG TPA: SGNH/GDSL hydrolase family protein [Burkholderiaceae bacterium]|nr:SGNH/GDSL hydrolase family protein [Burkholderiaceae bacterium]
MTVNVKGWRKALLGTAAAAMLIVLASCGGGEQVETFTAKRVFAFGDETSVINSDGSKYSINALTTSSTYDCSSNPLWIQSVAAIYGLVFPQCNPNAVAAPDSRIYAAAGAKVADLSAQIDQQVLSGGFADGDLATVLIGANDIVAQYQQYPSIGEDQLDDNLTQAANALGDQINRLADLGVKVVVSTVPDMGLTPFAGDPAGSNAALLTRLTAQFNIKMRTRIYNDGRRIGLVLLDEYLQTVRKFGLGYVNTTDAACLTSAPLPTCTTSTLTTDSSGTAASAATWLWSDSLHLSAGGQSTLGSLAVTRAQNNPF